MSGQLKQVVGKAAFGIVAMALIPSAVWASGINANVYHIDVTGDNQIAVSAAGNDFMIAPDSLIPAGCTVTIPHISGVEMFSNQAVFSFRNSSFQQNTPLSSAHMNADEAAFWQTSNDTATVFIGASDAQLSATANIENLSLNSSYVRAADFSPAAAVKKGTPSLDLPVLNDGSIVSGVNSAAAFTKAAGLNIAPVPSTTIALANPVLGRDISVTNLTPEPASLGLIAVFGTGLLARRRMAR